MTNDFERLCQPRVGDICKRLAQILKTARSQKATHEDVARVLRPAAEALTVLVPSAVPDPEPPPPAPEGNAAGSLDAVADLKWADAARLVSAIPDGLVAPVITRLVDRLVEAAWIAKE